MSLFRTEQLELGSIATRNSAPPSPWTSGSVLLTGATGLLGSALLESILTSSAATVVCLVRGSSDVDSEARLRAEAARRRIEVDWTRVEVICGDLAATHLGLDEARLSALAERFDLILHAGAEVAWFGNLGLIATTNLDSLRTMAALAGRGRPKRTAFVSSCSVYNADAYANAESVGEDPIAADPRGLRSPYVQSKWAGERLCGAISDRGMATSIFRVPYLFPHSRHPLPNPAGAVDLLLDASIRLGVAPEEGPTLPICPADRCARWMVRILAAVRAPRSIHNVVPFESLPWSALVAAARREGLIGESMPPAAWFELAREASRAQRELRAVVTLLSHDPTRTLWSRSNICRVRLDDASTRVMVPGLEALQRLDEPYLRRVVRVIVEAIGDGESPSDQARPPE